MSKITTCEECDGTGKYLIYNAYDLTDIEEIRCDYCYGQGVDVVVSATLLPKSSVDSDGLPRFN